MGFRQLWNEGQEHAMELKLADNPTIEIVSEKAFLDALEKTNADALETLSEKQEEYKRIWSTARSVGRDFHGLTDGQKKAFDLVKEGKNVYLTGLAGTGKSYIVERIIEWAQTSGLNVITCAPTGIAAIYANISASNVRGGVAGEEEYRAGNLVIRAETVHWHDFEHSVVARHVDTAIENSRPHVSGGDGVGTDAVLGERCGKVT